MMQRADRRVSRSFLPLVLGLAMSTGLLSRPSEATVFRAVSVDDLARRADAVVVLRRGEGASNAHWSRGRIVTDEPLEVVSVLTDRRGLVGSSRSITVTLPGGTVGAVSQRVSGAPVFVREAVQVVFLQRLSDGRWTVYDMGLGAFPLRPMAGGAWQVMPPSDAGIELVDSAGQPVGMSALQMPTTGVTLTAFQQRVEAAIR